MTSDVRSVNSVVEEREREELGEELGVIRWTVENEVTDPADFVPAKRVRKHVTRGFGICVRKRTS